MIYYLYISCFIFLIGVSGIFLARKNLILILISLELVLLSINLNFLSFSSYLDDILGIVYFLFILSIAAAESAIGLAVLLAYYRLRGNIDLEFINSLKA